MVRSLTSNHRPRRLPRADLGQSTLGGVLVGAFLLLAAGAVLGLAANHFSSRRIPIFPKPGKDQQPVALPLPPGVRSMNPMQAYAAFRAGTALFLDGRAPEEYAAGHIPGALNLPAADFEAVYPDLAERVDAAHSLVAYCQSIECGEGVEIADRVRELVPKPIFVFELGWEAWQASGFPARKGEQP